MDEFQGSLVKRRFPVWLGTFIGRGSFDLVVRRQRLPQMMSCGEAVGLRLLLLLHLGPQRKPALEAEVKELSAGEAQRVFCQQSFQSSSPPVQHCGSRRWGGVSRTPEYLRSENLKSTEVQSAVLKEIQMNQRETR